MSTNKNDIRVIGFNKYDKPVVKAVTGQKWLKRMEGFSKGVSEKRAAKMHIRLPNIRGVFFSGS